MTAMIGPGSLVKCIRKNPWNHLVADGIAYSNAGPVFNEVCRVKCVGFDSQDEELLMLERYDIPHPTIPDLIAAFSPEWFVPLDEDHVDISVFTDIINKVNANPQYNVARIYDRGR